MYHSLILLLIYYGCYAFSASISNEDVYMNDESVRNIMKELGSFINTRAQYYNATDSVLEDILGLMKKLSVSQPRAVSEQSVQYNMNENSEGKESAFPQGSVIYGSPICIYQCVILQVYWADSSVSILGVQLPHIPTFPEPVPSN